MEESKQIVEDRKQTNQLIGNLLTAVGIVAACGWIIFKSVVMSADALDKGIARIYTVPGLLPLIIASLVMGLCLFVAFYYLRRMSVGRPDFKRSFRSLYVPALVFGLLFIYIYILIPNIPFVLSTIIFTSLFMAVFNATSVLKITLSSLVYSVLVVYFFVKVVGTRFPISLIEF